MKHHGKPILYDLSPPVTPSTAVWPGDTAFAIEWTNRIGAAVDKAQGFAVNLSTVRTTVHLASHADAPLHTEVDGASIDQMALEIYVGHCRVVEAHAGLEVLGVGDVPGLEGDLPPRVLIKTGSIPGADRFSEDFAALSPELADFLHRAGVRLVGTDAPSVDPFDSRELMAHHALLGRGIAILEGLALAPVPIGDYELIALPLRWVGLDASPVRAVLRTVED